MATDVSVDFWSAQVFEPYIASNHGVYIFGCDFLSIRTNAVFLLLAPVEVPGVGFFFNTDVGTIVLNNSGSVDRIVLSESSSWDDEILTWSLDQSETDETLNVDLPSFPYGLGKTAYSLLF